MTCIISSHFTLSLRGVSKCVFSCTRISDKVPGKLGGASTGDTRLLSKFPRHHVARSRFRTSIQTSPTGILQQKQSLSEIARLHVQNSPVYRFFIPSFQRVIHDDLAVMSQPSTERNRTIPLPAFLPVVGCLLNSRKF